MMAAFNYSITRPITDSFHEGEYLGGLWTIRSYLSGTTPFPLLVHGPMDFLPAMLAGAQSHDQAIIVLTRAINTGVAGITWILFFDVLLKLLLRNEHRLAAGLLSVALFIGMIAIIPADVVERQQAFLAIRDLFLMAALWCTLTGLSARSPQRRHLLLLLGGVAAAASLYWAYDRFLATVAFGCPLILALLLQRAWKPAATLIVGGVAGLFVIPLIAPTGTLAKNAANLTYWLTFSGEVWHISILVRMPAIPTAIAMIVLLMIFAKMWMAEWKEQRTDLSLSFVAGLLGLQAFFLIKYFNLPRQPNNYYFVWPFVLLLAGLTLRSPLLGRINDMLRDFWTAIHAGGARQRVGLAPVTLSLVAIISNNMAFASLMNLRALVRPPCGREHVADGGSRGDPRRVDAEGRLRPVVVQRRRLRDRPAPPVLHAIHVPGLCSRPLRSRPAPPAAIDAPGHHHLRFAILVHEHLWPNYAATFANCRSRHTGEIQILPSSRILGGQAPDVHGSGCFDAVAVIRLQATRADRRECRCRDCRRPPLSFL